LAEDEGLGSLLSELDAFLFSTGLVAFPSSTRFRSNGTPISTISCIPKFELSPEDTSTGGLGKVWPFPICKRRKMKTQ
jgi:hypothetical protein